MGQAVSVAVLVTVALTVDVAKTFAVKVCGPTHIYMSGPRPMMQRSCLWADVES